MGRYLDPATLGIPDAEEVAVIIEAHAKLVAPCLFSGSSPADLDVPAVTAILTDAAKAWAASGGGRVKRRTTGPFTREYDNGGESVLSQPSIALLRAMCPAVDEASGVAGLPSGTFPAAGYYDSLFAGIRYRRGH